VASTPVSRAPETRATTPAGQSAEEPARPAPGIPSNGVSPPDPARDWVSLEAWALTNHLSGAALEAAGANAYELRGANGVMTLASGSLRASLDGFDYWLGYAPRVSNGRLLVHVLDAGKNLFPLATAIHLPPAERPTIVIDPGHGGDDSGTRSVTDARSEKEFTLDWALRLGLLMRSNGWSVILTRTNDVDVSLADRVALADRAGADLFVSLHFNSALPRRDQSGVETYCVTPAGMPSTLTRDYADDLTRIFPNNTFDAENLRYAFLLHRAIVKATGVVDRGVKRARFMSVLRSQNRPAVLIEGGYLSNPGDAERISTPGHRQKLAEAVARALDLHSNSTSPDSSAAVTEPASNGAAP
jgi:N-acetylmuramoyl-L-alanine amidase